MYRLRVCKYQKEQTKLSNYLKMSIRGNLSQTLNVRKPNNDENDSLCKTIMFEAMSAFFQEGTISYKRQKASCAKEQVRLELSNLYLAVSDQVWIIREKQENKQKKNKILRKCQKSMSHNNQQYKLHTRSIVNLLNFEQAIHRGIKEIESYKYFIKKFSYKRDLNNTSTQGF